MSRNGKTVLGDLNKQQMLEMVHITPIFFVSNSEIRSLLLTPMVKAFLGKLLDVKHESRQTVKGAFDGDEVTNLPGHQIYGRDGYVRYPYLVSTYRTENGALVIKRDGVKFEALGWWGNIDKPKPQLIFCFAMKDRRYDGTVEANDSALVNFPYDDPAHNKPRCPAGWSSVELSIYGFMPNCSVLGYTGEPEFARFIQGPFAFLNDPEKFLEFFWRAWKTDLAPGQISAPIPDISKLIAPQFDKIAYAHGYDMIESAPSHYHVAMWAQSVGYRFCDAEDIRTMRELAAGIRKLKESGVKLTRQQESWVCVLQHLPKELIKPELYLGGAKWPQTNVDQKNLWMLKPISERAKALDIQGPKP